MNDIEVKYCGETITTLDSQGEKVLNTSGKYLSDNIKVKYNKDIIVPSKDVNFYDYDGKILYSYSYNDFMNLSEFPPNPKHQGLTAQGWNWSLQDAKNQLAVSGILDIGQNYITTDGKTRVYISLKDLGRMSPKIYWNQTVANGVTVDFGDGSAPQTVAGTGLKSLTHLYSSIGDYIITLNVTSGTMLIGGTSSSSAIISGSPVVPYRNIVTKVEIGKDASLNTYAFYCMYLLRSVSIPSTITSITSFYGCYSLPFIAIPSNCTSIANTAFRGCFSMPTISIPKGLQTLGQNAFYNDYCLSRIALPRILSINSSTLYSCTGLRKLVIPSSVTSIGAGAFSNCTGMAEYHFKSLTPPTLADSTVFTNIPNDCKIYVPIASLETYKTGNVWSDFQSYIMGE